MFGAKIFTLITAAFACASAVVASPAPAVANGLDLLDKRAPAIEEQVLDILYKLSNETEKYVAKIDTIFVKKPKYDNATEALVVSELYGLAGSFEAAAASLDKIDPRTVRLTIRQWGALVPLIVDLIIKILTILLTKLLTKWLTKAIDSSATNKAVGAIDIGSGKVLVGVGKLVGGVLPGVSKGIQGSAKEFAKFGFTSTLSTLGL